MKVLRKSLLGVALMLCSGTLLADCPQVGGHTVSSHTANYAKCVYAANQRIIGLNQNQHQQCVRNFILTDPHYRLVSCKFSHELRKCVCVIAKIVRNPR